MRYHEYRWCAAQDTFGRLLQRLSAFGEGAKLPEMGGAVIHARVSSKDQNREPQSADPAARLRGVLPPARLVFHYFGAFR